jgi:hypothetical protein
VLLINGQACTDREGAKHFLRCGDDKLVELVRLGIVKTLWHGVYCYEDLVEAINTLREQRDGKKQGNTVHLFRDHAEGDSEGRRTIHGDGSLHAYATPEAFLQQGSGRSGDGSGEEPPETSR